MTTETKATPGPWKWTGSAIEAYAETTNFGERWNTIVMDRGITEANARLIAACPTMYTYLVSKAEQGDERAKEIIASIGNG